MADDRVLEPPTRLSESVAWELQRRFFETAGPGAWSEDVVPYYVTTNAYVARCYARVIAAWVEDLMALPDGHPDGGIDADLPIYVVELGAGTGRLSFLLAHELGQLSRDRDLPTFCVVGTDFAAANVERWPDHPDLREAFAAGRLDCARFDADHPAPLELVHAGHTLGPEPVGNPVVAVLNYVVDCLRQDAFVVKDGRLREITVQAYMPADSTRDEHADDATVDMQLRLGTRPAALPVYGDPVLDGLLARYVDSLHDAEVLLPVGTIRALRFLRGLGGGRLCALTGDKGYRRLNDLDGRTVGELVKCGCFSLMANLDAVGHELGGVSLTHDNRYSRFTVAAYSTVDGSLPRFRGAYRDHINDFGPAEYNRLFKLARKQWTNAQLPMVLLLLRLSGYDPTVFARWSSQVLEASADAGIAVRHDLATCLEQVLARTYAVAPRDDVRFMAGRVYYRIGHVPEAAAQFARVAAATPDRKAAWFNLGLCSEREGRPDEARQHYQRAVDLDAGYHRAQQALARLSA